MKNLIVFIIVANAIFNLSAQSYSILFDLGSETKWVHITVDTNYTSNSIFVGKQLIEEPIDTVLEQHTLLLLGNYDMGSYSASLNYADFNYFWIPFDPNEPFYNINQFVGSSVAEGTLTIANIALSSGPGDFTYWCTCGGHTPDAQTPGGCLSNMSQGRIRCIPDGEQCAIGCVGTFIEHNKIIPGVGGGVLIQVSSAKSTLVHNFASQE